MNAGWIRLFRQAAAAPLALCVPLTLVAVTGGCSEEKAVEQSPEQFEKARDAHMEMMRRERGMAPPTDAGK